jgi:Alcohol dehydrogenase GroES-like domain
MHVAEVTAYGSPEVLRLAARPDPAPEPDEVVVRIRAANVNPTDIALRAGHHPTAGLDPPFVPGWDLAGEVAAVGSAVSAFSPGDRVVGMIPFGRIGGRVGAYAQAAAVDPGWLAPLPGDVDAPTAATLPLNALTARQALDLIALPAEAHQLNEAGGLRGKSSSRPEQRPHRRRGRTALASAARGTPAVARASMSEVRFDPLNVGRGPVETPAVAKERNHSDQRHPGRPEGAVRARRRPDRRADHEQHQSTAGLLDEFALQLGAALGKLGAPGGRTGRQHRQIGPHRSQLPLGA